MTISSDHLPASDTLVALIGIITKSVEGAAGLSVKIDNVAIQQASLSTKVDRVSEGIAELKEKTSSVSQVVDVLRTSVMDHETRLRSVEPKAIKVLDVESEVTALKRIMAEKDAAHEKDIVDIKLVVTRYAAFATAAVLALQILLTTVIGPWISSLVK